MNQDETNPEFNGPEKRDQLYAEWRRYWNTSKPILLEKSPRHMLMTRLLQYWFSAERSFFVVVLRHPLASIRHAWARSSQGDCGSYALRTWFLLHEILFDDLKLIKNSVVVHYERFALGNAEGIRYNNHVHVSQRSIFIVNAHHASICR